MRSGGNPKLERVSSFYFNQSNLKPMKWNYDRPIKRNVTDLSRQQEFSNKMEWDDLPGKFTSAGREGSEGQKQ